MNEDVMASLEEIQSIINDTPERDDASVDELDDALLDIYDIVHDIMLDYGNVN